MLLWLDDIRDPYAFIKIDWRSWTWAKTAEEAIALLRTGKVEYASLDHDLTDEQMERGGMLGQIYEDGHKSGYDVVEFLEQHPEFWPRDGVNVHSANPVGKKRMQQVIDRHYKPVV